MLAAPSLWIDQGAHRRSEGVRLNRLVAVVRIPSLEQLNDLTAVWVIRLDLVDPFDGIATAEREEWIAAPFTPLLEAAERPAGFGVSGVLPTPSPDCQGRGEQLGSTSFDIVEQSKPNLVNPHERSAPRIPKR